MFSAHTRSTHPPITHTHTLTHISRSHTYPCPSPPLPTHTPPPTLPCADCARIPSSACRARGEWPGPCNIHSFDPAGGEHLYPRHLASSSFCRHPPYESGFPTRLLTTFGLAHRATLAACRSSTSDPRLPPSHKHDGAIRSLSAGLPRRPEHQAWTLKTSA